MLLIATSGGGRGKSLQVTTGFADGNFSSLQTKLAHKVDRILVLKDRWELALWAIFVFQELEEGELGHQDSADAMSTLDNVRKVVESFLAEAQALEEILLDRACHSSTTVCDMKDSPCSEALPGLFHG